MTQDRAAIAHGVTPRALPDVVVACMTGCPEERLFASIAPAAVRLVFHADRGSLLALVHALRPCAALLPPRDAAGSECAPLIARIRLETPDVRTYVVLAADSFTNGLVEAVRAGGEIADLRDAAGASAFLDSLHDEGRLSVAERQAAGALLAGLGPPVLSAVLMPCVMRAYERLTATDLAAAFGMSRSALTRRARIEHWPPPAELIEWGRLIYASVLMWREAASVVTLAQASGFESADALRRATQRRLGLSTSVPQDLTPLRVSAALRRRIAGSRE
jgi:AraC-like DNA-binding protein